MFNIRSAPAVGWPLARLQWGFFLLTVGARCSQLAIAWWALAQTGSVSQLSLMVGSAMAAEALSKPLLGWIGDTYGKIRIVRSGNLIVLGASLFILWLSTSSEFHAVPLAFAMIVIGAVVGVQDPIQGSIIPELVSEHLVADAFRSKATLWSMALVMGPGIAGFLLSSGGVWATLVADVGAIATATLLSFCINQPDVAPSARENDAAVTKRRAFISQLPSEFSIVYRVRMERYLALFAMAINFFLAPFFAIIVPVYVKEVAMLPPWYAGIVDACFGIGILLGSRALPVHMQRHLPRDRMIMLGFLMLGANVLALGLNLSTWVQPVFFLLGGVGLVWINVNTSIVRSLATPAYFRNRMMAIISFVSQCASPLGNACVGAMVSFGGVFSTSLTTGALIVVLVCLVRKIPDIQLFMRMPDEELDGAYAKIYPEAFRVR